MFTVSQIVSMLLLPRSLTLSAIDGTGRTHASLLSVTHANLFAFRLIECFCGGSTYLSKLVSLFGWKLDECAHDCSHFVEIKIVKHTKFDLVGITAQRELEIVCAICLAICSQVEAAPHLLDAKWFVPCKFQNYDLISIQFSTCNNLRRLEIHIVRNYCATAANRVNFSIAEDISFAPSHFLVASNAWETTNGVSVLFIFRWVFCDLCCPLNGGGWNTHEYK